MPGPSQRAQERAATIMMIDDEPTTLDVIVMFLNGEGYENFVAVTDSTVAFDAVAREVPDLLLLDLMMPKVGGLEILTAIGDRDHKKAERLVRTHLESIRSDLDLDRPAQKEPDIAEILRQR